MVLNDDDDDDDEEEEEEEEQEFGMSESIAVHETIEMNRSTVINNETHLCCSEERSQPRPPVSRNARLRSPWRESM